MASYDWNHRTVRTLLARLVDKGAIGIRSDENRFLYTPLVSKEAYTRAAAKSFKEKYFGGDTKALLLHFAITGGISEDELQEIRKAVRSKRRPAKAKSRRG
jgi:BlaI family penicillinase repressor